MTESKFELFQAALEALCDKWEVYLEVTEDGLIVREFEPITIH